MIYIWIFSIKHGGDFCQTKCSVIFSKTFSRWIIICFYLLACIYIYIYVYVKFKSRELNLNLDVYIYIYIYNNPIILGDTSALYVTPIAMNAFSLNDVKQVEYMCLTLFLHIYWIKLIYSILEVYYNIIHCSTHCIYLYNLEQNSTSNIQSFRDKTSNLISMHICSLRSYMMYVYTYIHEWNNFLKVFWLIDYLTVKLIVCFCHLYNVLQIFGLYV